MAFARQDVKYSFHPIKPNCQMKKTATPRLRIAIVDDHVLLREMLATLCNNWVHGEVVLKAADGVDYEEQVAKVGKIDLAIVDLRMPRRDGYATMEWIREYQPETRMMALSHALEDGTVYHAMQSGAHAVVEKGISHQEFIACLESMRTTGYYTTPLMMQQLTHVPDPNSPRALRKKLEETLCPREMEYLKEYIKEESPSRNKIAVKMMVKPSTAESYRSNISEKTGARTRLGMFMMAVRFGLVKV